jgi:hypothetical protein
MSKITKTVSFDTETDRDILRWLDQQENRSAAVREAIRAHIERGGVTISDVYQIVKRLERKIEAGAVAIRAETAENDAWNEDPDLAAALAGLGKIGLDC